MRRVIALGLLSLVAAALGVYAVAWQPGEVGGGFVWPAGGAWRYRFVHAAETTVALPGGARALRGEAAVEAVYVLRWLGPAGDGARLGLRFEAVSGRIVVDGHELLPAGEAVGPEAVVELGRDGAVRAVGFGGDAGDGFRNLVQLALTEGQVRLGAGAAWAVDEVTALGVAESAYRRTGARAIERARAGYRSVGALVMHPGVAAVVEGAATIALGGDGLVERIEAREAVRAGAVLSARSETRLWRLGAVVASGAAPVVVDRVALGVVSRPAAVEATALADRAEGLGGAELVALLRAHGAAGVLPDHNRTLWRAVAALRLDPAACAALGALMGDAAIGGAGRGLVADLLASAGTSAAQAALRAGLATAAAVADPQYGVLFQRLGLVVAPDAETLDWLASRYVAPGPEGFGAAVYALGAAAGSAARAGEARGAELADRLVRELGGEADPERLRLRLVALGNAGIPAHLDAVLPYARAADPRLRAAAAAALRKHGTPAARAALVGLAVDGDVDVQRRALGALARAPLDAAGLMALAGAVSDGTLGEASLHRLLDLVAAAGDPAAQAVLDAVIARPLRDGRIRSRARVMRGG